ncbi:MAG TPA: ABC transporter ATP-binding protein [Planctomycetota bacterium]|nr:ABC transporter ATP-binding protein [Planctomycetota bacterium]
MIGTDAAPLLEVRDLAFSYGEREAVRGVSFEIRRGEIFGLLGPNGAGKTTTIACIAGLRRPSRGSLLLLGKPFEPALLGPHRARLGLVPQEVALYEELTARENLEFFGALSGLGGRTLGEAVDRGLTLAGLSDRARDRVGAYSGGMKRRLNLAAGDLHAPDLLLLDEPTAGVDPQSRSHLFESLRALAAQGRTLLYTTHYMEEAQRLCDRLAILDQGRVLGVGTAAELAHAAGLPGADLEAVFLQMTGRRLRDE